MSKNVLTRDMIEEKYKWDTKSFYKNQDVWNKDYEKVEKLLIELDNYRGKLGESSKSLLEGLKLRDDIVRTLRNLYSYASLRMDEDTRKPKYQALSDKAYRLSVKAGEKMAFFIPELLEIPSENIDKFLREREDLNLYEHFLKDLSKKKKHVLPEAEEAILAQIGEVTSVSGRIFGMLNNADLEFPSIKDEEGNEVKITHGSFIPLMESKDRRVRKETFKGLYSVYKSFENTFATILDGEIKGNKLYSTLRKYNSNLEASLSSNNIDKKVYYNLIDSVHEGLDHMYDYMKIRKRALNLEELHMYDIYTPIIDGIDKEYSFEEAKELITKGLEPLGKDYISILKEGFDSRWIDVYETEGKRSGGYSGGSYDSKPYILLNYKGNLDSVFTTAHEMGHSIHSYLSRKHQPFIYSNYGIFVAEVASTVNEILLINYMMEKAESKEERAYLLNHFLESFRGTVFRQTMFAEFELKINEYVEAGGALTAEYLNKTYGELNELYYGPEVITDEEIKSEWSRIPHFYYNFYVYQYATGFSAAVYIADRILKGEEDILEKYIEFLSSGSSKYPLDLLRELGLDMTDKEPVEMALKVFGEKVEELNSLI